MQLLRFTLFNKYGVFNRGALFLAYILFVYKQAE